MAEQSWTTLDLECRPVSARIQYPCGYIARVTVTYPDDAWTATYTVGPCPRDACTGVVTAGLEMAAPSTVAPQEATDG